MLNIPKSPEDISHEWLTAALHSSNTIDKANVISHNINRIGEAEGKTGYLARVELEYSMIEEGAPTSIIAKFSPNDPELLEELKVIYAREVKFYEEIAPEQDIPVPICYYQDIIPKSGESILLLEDLSHMRTVSIIDGCTEEEAELAIEGLAKVHASWWENPKLLNLDWGMSFAEAPYQDWWTKYHDRLKTILPDILVPDSFFEVGERFGSRMTEIVDQLEGAPITCIHRDIHVDNLLFGATMIDKPVIVVDWQTVGVGKGVSDIAYFLISSVPVEVRRKSEKGLLEKYHHLLLESGVQGYSFDECWNDYLLSAVGKLFITVAATVLIDNSSPHRTAWRRIDLQRLVAFIEDHNVEHLL